MLDRLTVLASLLMCYHFNWLPLFIISHRQVDLATQAELKAKNAARRMLAAALNEKMAAPATDDADPDGVSLEQMMEELAYWSDNDDNNEPQDCAQSRAAASTEPPEQGPPPEQAPLAEFAQLWGQAVSHNVALLDRFAAARDAVMQHRRYNDLTNLSLIVVSDAGEPDSVDVGYYYWARSVAARGLAHRVRLDGRNGVVYSVCNSLGSRQIDNDREIQAGRAVIVIADCGVTMIRCKDRPTMPADVVQVQNMFSCGYGAFSVHDACCICNSGDGDLKTCSCCMLTFHPSCSRSTAARIMSSGAVVPPKPAEALPPSWALCALCALHVGHQSVMIEG